MSSGISGPEIETEPAIKPLPAFLARFAVLARSVETEASLWLAGLSTIYLITTLTRATGRPLWFDEITTFYLARMDSVVAGWRATVNGADLQPPLMMALAHVSQLLLGPNPLATRLPAILGVMVACACIFAFIQRRSGTVFGICGALLILLTSAYHYAVEARPYGLVLAGAAIALVSWQRADDPRRGWRPLAGIALGLWIALASQCFSILLAVPFGAGEVVRSVRHKKIDWPVWLSFALSASALVFYPPLFKSLNAGFADNLPMFTPTFRSLWILPSHMIGGAGRVIAVVMVLIAWLRSGEESVRSRCSNPRADKKSVPVHEMVAVLVLAAIPIFLIALVAGLHSPVFYRYGLAAVLGMAILVTQACERIAGGDSRIGVVILLLMTGVFTERFVSDAFSRQDEQPGAVLMSGAGRNDIKVAGHPLLAMVTGDTPLVVSNPIWFPQVAQYAPPALAARTYYLTDSEAARKFAHTNFFEIAIPIMWRLPLRAHVVPYPVFTATHRRFLVYTSSNGFDWLMGRLHSDNPTFRFVGRCGDALLLEVCLQCETSQDQ
jgi:hypothetical protein